MYGLLKSIRLTYFFVGLIVLFLLLVIILPKTKFDSGALTLFSVNSFLYGFYLAPILSGQKGRIEEMHRIVRSEANAVFGMTIKLKKLPTTLRRQLKQNLADYLKACRLERRPAEGEQQYEALISFCLDYKGEHHKIVDKLLADLVDNQKNRTQLAMQLSNKVYSHEWMVILVLFSITISFVLLLDTGQNPVLRLVTAFLCTGLSMLLVILMKLSTLTHKKARQIWAPFDKLISTHFYRID